LFEFVCCKLIQIDLKSINQPDEMPDHKRTREEETASDNESPGKKSKTCDPVEADDHDSDENSVVVVTTMVEGVVNQGYLISSHELLDEFGETREDLSHEAQHLLSEVAEHISENIGMASTGEFCVAVKLINTLFEIAATVANLATARDDAEAKDLDALYDHAKRGLEMIGAADPV
jgi:hypothetical protein